LRCTFALLLSGTILIALPEYAAAHAFLEHSAPSADAVIQTAPAAVQLWFNTALEPAFSTVQVVDSNGRRMDDDRPAIGGKEPTSIQVGLAPLPPGQYTVVWRVVARDGHESHGTFVFTKR
jgi:copper resistance protein C